MQKIMIVPSMNVSPESDVEEVLKPLLDEGFRIISATTALSPHGEFSPQGQGEKCARHVYYVTTVLLEKQ